MILSLRIHFTKLNNMGSWSLQTHSRLCAFAPIPTPPLSIRDQMCTQQSQLTHRAPIISETLPVITVHKT